MVGNISTGDAEILFLNTSKNKFNIKYLRENLRTEIEKNNNEVKEITINFNKNLIATKKSDDI